MTSRQEKLETILRNPRSPINVESLLVSNNLDGHLALPVLLWMCDLEWGFPRLPLL